MPATRGPEVSRPAEDIINEARALKEAGVVEVSLLGQNVNSYGMVEGIGARRAPIPGYPSFAELLRMVGRIGIPRVRFITSHPINFDDQIMEAIADTPSVCRFIHLPVQSGSNRLLKRMAREYTREFYLDRASGELVYAPKPGEDPKRAEVIAPRLDTVLELRGDAPART